jgi:hypothetical protein
VSELRGDALDIVTQSYYVAEKAAGSNNDTSGVSQPLTD